MIKKVSSGQRIGEINIPASKSDAQRAILVAALVPNKSLIYNYGKSDDVKAMLSCIGVLGAEKAVKNEMKIPNKVDYESGNNWGEING